MLVLTRRKDERIRIGADIHVQVVEIKGRQVRLGIEAPRNIPVDREEIALRRDGERQPAGMAGERDG